MLWLVLLSMSPVHGHIQLVINTWDFHAATSAAFNALIDGASALDAVEEVRQHCATDHSACINVTA